VERVALRKFMVATFLCLVGCVSVHDEDRSASSSRISDSDQLSVPLMVTQIVSLKGPATLSYVHGVCYIVRDETGSETPRKGEALRDGDLLDLDDDCSVRIHSSGRPDIKLRRENGRFFKLEIKQ
jgi:hypothetical protein